MRRCVIRLVVSHSAGGRMTTGVVPPKPGYVNIRPGQAMKPGTANTNASTNHQQQLNQPLAHPFPIDYTATDDDATVGGKGYMSANSAGLSTMSPSMDGVSAAAAKKGGAMKDVELTALINGAYVKTSDSVLVYPNYFLPNYLPDTLPELRQVKGLYLQQQEGGGNYVDGDAVVGSIQELILRARDIFEQFGTMNPNVDPDTAARLEQEEQKVYSGKRKPLIHQLDALQSIMAIDGARLMSVQREGRHRLQRYYYGFRYGLDGLPFATNSPNSSSSSSGSNNPAAAVGRGVRSDAAMLQDLVQSIHSFVEKASSVTSIESTFGEKFGSRPDKNQLFPPDITSRVRWYTNGCVLAAGYIDVLNRLYTRHHARIRVDGPANVIGNKCVLEVPFRKVVQLTPAAPGSTPTPPATNGLIASVGLLPTGVLSAFLDHILKEGDRLMTALKDIYTNAEQIAFDRLPNVPVSGGASKTASGSTSVPPPPISPEAQEAADELKLTKATNEIETTANNLLLHIVPSYCKVRLLRSLSELHESGDLVRAFELTQGNEDDVKGAVGAGFRPGFDAGRATRPDQDSDSVSRSQRLFGGGSSGGAEGNRMAVHQFDYYLSTIDRVEKALLMTDIAELRWRLAGGSSMLQPPSARAATSSAALSASAMTPAISSPESVNTSSTDSTNNGATPATQSQAGISTAAGTVSTPQPPPYGLDAYDEETSHYYHLANGVFETKFDFNKPENGLTMVGQEPFRDAFSSVQTATANFYLLVPRSPQHQLLNKKWLLNTSVFLSFPVLPNHTAPSVSYQPSQKVQCSAKRSLNAAQNLAERALKLNRIVSAPQNQRNMIQQRQQIWGEEVRGAATTAEAMDGVNTGSPAIPSHHKPPLDDATVANCYKLNVKSAEQLRTLAFVYADSRDYLYASGLFNSALKVVERHHGRISEEALELQELMTAFQVAIGSPKEAEASYHRLNQLWDSLGLLETPLHPESGSSSSSS